MKLTVVIVNYNVKHYLHQCLYYAERALTGISSEVIVVDNNSTDGSLDMLRPLHPDVRFIQNTDNVGFARANNQAIRTAHGQYVLLLNPDTIVGESTFREVIQLMDNRPDAGAVGVRMLNPDGTFAPESRRAIPTPLTAFFKMTGMGRLFPKSRLFGRYYMSYLPERQVCEIQVCSGAFMCIRATALLQCGMLDEDYFMYGEDIDLSYRLLSAGLHNLYLPTPIIHYKGESTHSSTLHYVRVFYNAMLIFLRKHFSHYTPLVTIPIKCAIFAKAIEAYIRLKLFKQKQHDPERVLDYLRKSQFVYVQLGDNDDSEAIRAILDHYQFKMTRQTVSDATATREHLCNIHQESKADFIIINAETSKIDDILHAFDQSTRKHPCPYLATYFPSIDTVITPFMVLTH